MHVPAHAPRHGRVAADSAVNPALTNGEMRMKSNTSSASPARWITRLWRTLAAWEEAANTDPLEALERRISALERELRAVKYAHKGEEVGSS
jgi:hypothetical protein